MSLDRVTTISSCRWTFKNTPNDYSTKKFNYFFFTAYLEVKNSFIFSVTFEYTRTDVVQNIGQCNIWIIECHPL